MKIETKNIALLIDGENISPSYIEIIVDEANKYGKINYRRVYGDWTTTQLSSWKDKINEFGLTPVQQYAYTLGKNVSDFTLIIDAMDILYSGKVDSFAIVTSDSDFTKLVTRLKEDNIFVIGMGESKTPIALVNSSDAFTYLDKMRAGSDENNGKEEPPAKGKTKRKTTASKTESSITPLKKIKAELKQIINTNAEDDGYAYWSVVAQLLQKKFPGFHPRNYGQQVRPITFFENMKEFEIKREKTVIHIKNK